MVVVSNDWQLKDGDTTKTTTQNINILNNSATAPNTTAISTDTTTSSAKTSEATLSTTTTSNSSLKTVVIGKVSGSDDIKSKVAGKEEESSLRGELLPKDYSCDTVAVNSKKRQQQPSPTVAAAAAPTPPLTNTNPISNNNCNTTVTTGVSSTTPVASPLIIMDVKSKSDETNGDGAREKHESETNSELVLRSDDLNCPTNTDFELENNNLDFGNFLADVNGENSNTNTLLGSHRQSPQSREMTLTSAAIKSTAPASLNSVINTVLSTNSANAQLATTTFAGATTTTTMTMGGNNGALYHALGIALNNGALTTTQATQQQLPSSQQQQQPIINNNKSYGMGIIDTQPIGIGTGNHNTSAMVVATPAAEVEHSGGGSIDNSGEAKIILLCESNSHPFQTRSIALTPNIECKVGRLIAKSKANETNAIFDCKVLSRNHAVLWYTDDGKFWVKDTKSSNGTFINDNKLGNDPAELHYGDVVKFGVDVLENSRKEVHGCIIAMVKLYLPDGRESISIDAQAHRLQFSGGNRITFDEMQRLNSFMQEATQREKVLKQKLCNLQNVLDATRKNSALCWQSMISEDQLLHKINLLEKKVQVMEKNVPENTLRNEIMKLLDDKTAYQLTAKEALRKVYQERCDALQMLSKMEAAYATSENECGILRDQTMNTKQTLEEVNDRLLQLETEYNEFKDDAARVQREAKEQDENCLAELRIQLAGSLQECETLRAKVAEIEKQLTQHAHNDKLHEEQALAKLDEVLDDMGIDDEDENDDDDDEDDDVVDKNAINAEEEMRNLQNLSLAKPKKKSKEEKALGQKVVRKSTVMKWLQSSDLNKGDDAQNLLKAFLNAGDDQDHEQEMQSSPDSLPNTDSCLTNDSREKDIERVCTKFSSILESVQMNLQKVENESVKLSTKKTTKAEAIDDSDDDDESVDGEMANDEFDIKGSDATADTNKRTSSKNYQLLQASVNTLRDAFNEFCQQQTTQAVTSGGRTQFQNDDGSPKLQTQATLVSPQPSHVHDNDIAEGDATNANVNEELPTEQTLEMLQLECESWRDKYSELNVLVTQLREQKESLEQLINNQVSPLTQQPERISAGTAELSEPDVYTTASSANADDQKSSGENSEVDQANETFEEQMRSELASMNSNQLEQEEELVLYKERLEQSESCNLQLRNEIGQLKLKQQTSAQLLLRQALPFGAVAIAALVYLLSDRF